MKSLAFGLVMTFSLASTAQAGAISLFNEFEGDGDLSNDIANPTVLDLVPGSNLIIGATEPGANGSPEIGPDIFTVTIGATEFLSSIGLNEYVGTDDIDINQSFFAVQSGPSIAEGTLLANDPPYLGAALIGAAPGAQEGDNILDDLGLSVPIAEQEFVGFDPAGLGPGTYTFLIQETVGDGIERYELDFAVEAIPEPATILGASAALGLGAFFKRRKRSA